MRRPDVVYSSPLSRARKTAELILEAFSHEGRPTPEIHCDSRLKEANCGDWQGLLHEEIRKSEPQKWASLKSDDLGFSFPNGEALRHVLQRFTAAINEIRGRHSAQNVLVVSHGGPIRLFLTLRGVLRDRTPGYPPRNLEGFIIHSDEIELYRTDFRLEPHK